MKIYKDIDASEFEFWAGAKVTVATLTAEQLATVWGILEDDGTEYTETEINDFFWFEDDLIAEWLGFADWAELCEHNKEVTK